MADSTGNSDSLLAANKAATPPPKAGYGELAANTGKMENVAGEMEKARKEPLPAVPKAPDLTQSPEFKDKSPLEAFGSIATTFGLLASLATRAPLTAGLNAAGDAMRSLREGNVQNFELKMQEWKAHTDMALKQFDTENAQFNNIVNNRKLSQSEMLGQLNALAAANRNVGLQMQLRQGDSRIALEGARLAEAARARTQAHADAVAARAEQLQIEHNRQLTETTKTLFSLGVPPEAVSKTLDQINQGVPMAQALQDAVKGVVPHSKEVDSAIKETFLNIDPKNRSQLFSKIDEARKAGETVTPEMVYKMGSDLGAKTTAQQSAKKEEQARYAGTVVTQLDMLRETLNKAEDEGSAVTGFEGKLAKLGRPLGLGGAAAKDVESQITTLQKQLKVVLASPNSRITPSERADANSVIEGLGNFSNIDDARKSLTRLQRVAMSIAGPPVDAPLDAKLIPYRDDPKDPRTERWIWAAKDPTTGKMVGWEY